MDKPLFKVPEGGYYEILKVTEDSTQSEFQQEPETSMLLNRKVHSEAFMSGLCISVRRKICAASRSISLKSRTKQK
jgi:hypothetical protein